MTIHTVTRDAFNAWARTNAEILRDNNWIQFDPDPEVFDDAFDNLRMFLECCTEPFNDMMIENGLRLEPDCVTFDSDKLDAIETVSALVQSDYECENDRNTNMPDSPWVIYKLGGDDDVDYNGTYIDSAIMLLSLFSGIPYCNYPHIPHVA